MDPYLEDPAFWPDFHHRFIDDWCDAIAERLPAAYEARLNESVNLVQMSPEVIKLIYPDVAVSQRTTPRGSAGMGTGTLLLEPVSIPNEFVEEVRQAHIEILHRPDRSLIAVLELLSPTNKTGDGFEQYRAKRKAVLQQAVHLVELDLLIGGTRPPLLRPLPQGDYFALVSRADDRPNCDVFAWSVRDRLPTIPIPLKAPDADVFVDLSKVFQTTFKRGRYANALFYDQPPKSPLNDKDSAWAATLAHP